jgi:nucleoside-diphosphate-sugar epimerase
MCGHTVVGLSRGEATSGQKSSIERLQGDLLKPGEAERMVRAASAEALIHLAWITEPGLFWHSPENDRWLDASRRLIEAFAAAGGRRIVVAGTCAEYAWSDQPLSEAASPLQPSTPYGQAKAQLFREMPSLVGAEATWSWGRIFFPYGPGEQGKKFVPFIVDGLRRGERIPLTSGEQARDFLYVEDVAQAFVRLVESPTFQGAVNVASGIATPLRDVGETLGRLASRPDLLGWGDLPPREGDPSIVVADVTRAREELGFEPSVPLEEGLRRTWEASSGGT